MGTELIFSMQDAVVTFGDKTLFDGLAFQIHEGAKVCLVGRNGTGKTTLMNLITGDREPDGGIRWLKPGATIGYLQQEVPAEPGRTVFDFVFNELPEDIRTSAHEYKVDVVLEPLGLQREDRLERLSGGQLRRAALARALVEEPDVLLLDEPTNHLDLGAIRWLEEYLKEYRGALVCVSHDKVFLAAISNQVFWLDRGKLKVSPKGFAHFDDWSQSLLEQEERELRNRQKFVEQEVEWASRGVPARRKRNQARLANMKAARDKLRLDQDEYKRATAKVEFTKLQTELSSRAVAEFIDVDKKFVTEDGRTIPILKRFNHKIMRGDRIGILGRNGSGKTSFIRMLTGDSEPDAGKVKMARELKITHFDQNRADLNPEWSMLKTLCPLGGDHVDVMGKSRHVYGYLADFMFDPKDALQPVKTLSGGQKNRLLLAKILADPGSFLILDEPTNDLDMDTLDLLEEILCAFSGTRVVVTHDRDFLDQTVTRILAFEGDAVVEEYIGGYSDYIAIKGEIPVPGRPAKSAKSGAAKSAPAAAKPASKLSYKLQFELDNLPARIAKLEKEIAALETEMEDPSLYAGNPKRFAIVSSRVGAARTELDEAEMRWLELEEMAGAGR